MPVTLIFRQEAAKIFAFFFTVMIVGCSVLEPIPPTAPPLGSGVDSPQRQLLIGKWRMNDGLLGVAFLDFKADDTLIIEDNNTGELYTMTYIFVDEETIALSGYDAFNGTANIEINGRNMGFAFTGPEDVFARIYPDLMRISE